MDCSLCITLGYFQWGWNIIKSLLVLSLTCCILAVVGSRFDARREIGQTDPSTTLSWITFKSIQIMRTFPKRGKCNTLSMYLVRSYLLDLELVHPYLNIRILVKVLIIINYAKTMTIKNQINILLWLKEVMVCVNIVI